jgi:hypothetical protein
LGKDSTFYFDSNTIQNLGLPFLINPLNYLARIIHEGDSRPLSRGLFG